LAFKTRRQCFDGAVLVGDACGYVDPMTGEGMFFALKGAEILASQLAAALANDRRDADSLREYARMRKREVTPRLLAQQGTTGRPTLRNARAHAAQAAGTTPRHHDLLVSMTETTCAQESCCARGSGANACRARVIA
jgi:2-polyprenyl-6-methoxyphenol hydroxylase-like FAD-dependent oxidoreductase